MFYTGFNGDHDDLDIASFYSYSLDAYNYSAFHWGSTANYDGGSNLAQDLTYFNAVDSENELLQEYGDYYWNSGDDVWTADSGLANDLVIFANNGSFNSVNNAMISADAEGFENWFDDIHLVIADGSGDAADIDVYTWNGNGFTLNAVLSGAYSEFFDGSGNVYDSNLATFTYEHAYTHNYPL
jgi:hypothetical protein